MSSMDSSGRRRRSTPPAGSPDRGRSRTRSQPSGGRHGRPSSEVLCRVPLGRAVQTSGSQLRDLLEWFEGESAAGRRHDLAALGIPLILRLGGILGPLLDAYEGKVPDALR